jgi:cytoskeletal protein RodZ
LKEIGSELQQAREAMGVSIEEAATDLKLKPSQLENVEKGNRNAFRDVFELKQIIRDYAKYLSLEYEKLEDEFNEFVFEYTSKIPLEEIAKANEELKLEKREIMSPYTIEFKRRFSAIRISIIILFMVVIGIIAYLVIDKIGNEETTKVNNLTYLISGNDGRGW